MNTRQSAWKSIFSQSGLVMLLTGFASGLPLLLTSRTLQIWMTDAQVDIKQTGLAILFGTPYTWKFMWAPIMDRYVPSFLGRRRGWMLITQIGLVLSLLMMSLINPADGLLALAGVAVVISFFSASQDIVLDAYRREYLPEEEIALGTSIFNGGYRLAMWIAGAGALYFSTLMSWAQVYQLMALFSCLGLATTFYLKEPKLEHAPPKSLRESVIDPLKDFFSKQGAVLILIFILLYKVGDNMAGNVLGPFYLKMGYSKEEIAIVAKTLSLFTSIGGGILGGIIVQRIGILTSLIIFGILQSVSTLTFVALTMNPPSFYLLGLVVGLEDLTSGMGAGAFLAFLATLTNRKFTATQYAMFSSLAAFPSRFIAAPAGFFVEALGWQMFFVFCAALAIPGLLLIPIMNRMKKSQS